MLRVEPGRVENVVARLGDGDEGKTVAVEMAAQGRQDLLRINPDDEAQLAARPGARRHGVDRFLRVAGAHRENLERAPGEQLFRRAQAGLAPGRIDRGAALAGMNLAIGERALDRVGNAVRHPLRNADLALRADDRRNRVRKLDRRIGEQPAPIAGMMPAIARVDPEIEQIGAAIAEIQRRLVGGESRAVRCDERIGDKHVSMLRADLAQAR